ncbi:hypothetical protein [Clostridium paraputrificum]|uniref:hypothetical protein n=1 Tax=Clostridium paraputrificum TaxID=29363 RepID=UPI0018970491|nr:hypothetical protein [Clostridium paraputrificum]MDB2124089.1 hypothetical protein [Clostridium paraputrificum]
MKNLLNKDDIKTILLGSMAFGIMTGVGNTLAYLRGNFSMESIMIGLISALSAIIPFTIVMIKYKNSIKI